MASQWYDIGLASEFVVAPEYRISRKPYIIGFEGAASIPYSGCVALDALKKAGLNEHTCKEKRILIQEGCSPVGCVISQLTKKWGAHVAATCFFKSAPVSTALGMFFFFVSKNVFHNFSFNFMQKRIEVCLMSLKFQFKKFFFIKFQELMT